MTSWHSFNLNFLSCQSVAVHILRDGVCVSFYFLFGHAIQEPLADILSAVSSASPGLGYNSSGTKGDGQ